MNELTQRSDSSLCLRKVCDHANGKNAETLTIVTVFLLTILTLCIALKYLRLCLNFPNEKMVNKRYSSSRGTSFYQ
jgi:hypothetical protein